MQYEYIREEELKNKISKDYLGSVQSLSEVNSQGNVVVVAEFSFDAWGKARAHTNWTYTYQSDAFVPGFDILERGFTGHEHLTEFGLINMNGRVYDRKLGQFIQPDNYIQAPGFSQSYNRFSYCMNNPVNFTDPSGEIAILDDIAVFALLAKICIVTGNTYVAWNNYGREAGLNTLTNFLFETLKGYAAGIAAGVIIDELIIPVLDYIGGGGQGSSPYWDVVANRATTEDVIVTATRLGEIGKPFLKEISRFVNSIPGQAAINTVTSVKTMSEREFEKNPKKFEINPKTGEATGYGAYNPGDEPMYEAVLLLAEAKTAELLINGTIKVLPKAISLSKGLISKGSISKGVVSKEAVEVSNIVCFVAGTAVLTNYGLTNIENIKTGDSVWTYNIEDGTSEIAVVTNNFVRNSENFVKLHLGADTIVCTEEHPFFENDGWVAAKDLRQGDSLFAFSGVKLRIDSLYQFRTDTATTVYNLEVAGNNDFYISASKVLVHNACDIINSIYKSIKDAPLYPKGFSSVKNGLKKVNIKDKNVLEMLRKIESGNWKKVYQNGYDAFGNKTSIHYFQSQSGKVFNVKTLNQWSTW